MLKKLTLFLGFFILAGGIVFSEEADTKSPLPKNTITVDIGPTIYGLGLAGIYNLFGDFYSLTGFGIAAQYERQITEKVSLAGRFAYGGTNFATKDISDVDIRLGLSSISIEGHGRFYPWGNRFFLDGMLGYANLSMDFFSNTNGGIKHTEHYFKLGAKVGWRIDFGKHGGFVFEPAFGYSGVLGRTKQFNNISKELEDSLDVNDIMVLILFSDNSIHDFLANSIFIGGFKTVISFGYRF